MTTTNRILIVEEDPPIRELLIGLLTDEGYEVSVAQNCKSTLDVADNFDPDLIVLDLSAPYYPESLFLRDYRNRPGRHVPIIGMGTSRYGSRYVEAVRTGLDSFVSMPFDLDDFMRQIRNYLPITQ
jgi:two-component system KDP operon response regulator KdpE